MNLSKIKWTLVVLLFLLSVSGLTAQVTRAATVVTEEVKYLGDGFNTVKKDYAGNMALEFPKGALMYDGVGSDSKYYIVSSKKDLKKLFTSDFGGSIGDTSSITDNSEITKKIETCTSFSEDKVTIVAYWKQVDKKVYANGLPKLNDSALAISKSDPKHFMQLYGDRFVYGVNLGKMFYVVYQADISNVAEGKRSSATQAVELSYQKISGALLNQSQETFISENLSNVKIESKTYAVGFPDFIGPYSRDDFKNIQYQVSQSQTTAIEKMLKNYSYTSNYGGSSFFDPSDYYKMANEWEQHVSLLNYITSSGRISSSLKRDCTTAYNNAAAQLELVYALDSSARYPGSDVSTFTALYNRYITERQIKRKWYSTTIGEKQYTGSIDTDLSVIGDVETIQITAETFNLKDNGLPNSVFDSVTTNVIMYLESNGSYSEFKRTTYKGLPSSTLLYEGIKFADIFRFSFTINADKFSWKVQDDIAIRFNCKYLERMTDLVWLYLNDNGLLTTSSN